MIQCIPFKNMRTSSWISFNVTFFITNIVVRQSAAIPHANHSFSRFVWFHGSGAVWWLRVFTRSECAQFQASGRRHFCCKLWRLGFGEAKPIGRWWGNGAQHIHNEYDWTKCVADLGGIVDGLSRTFKVLTSIDLLTECVRSLWSIVGILGKLQFARNISQFIKWLYYICEMYPNGYFVILWTCFDHFCSVLYWQISNRQYLNRKIDPPGQNGRRKAFVWWEYCGIVLGWRASTSSYGCANWATRKFMPTNNWSSRCRNSNHRFKKIVQSSLWYSFSEKGYINQIDRLDLIIPKLLSHFVLSIVRSGPFV